MDACFRFLRLCLYMVNFLIFLGGIALIVIGGLALHDQSYFDDIVTDTSYKSASYVILGSGIFLVVLVCMGFYGAHAQIKCFLLTYVMVLLLFFVVLLIGGVLAFVFKTKLSQPVINEMERKMMSYSTDPKDKQDWDTVQRVFKCCGIYGPEDWTRIPVAVKVIPESCCKKNSTTITCVGVPTPENSYKEGCLATFKNTASGVGIIAFIVTFFDLLGLILACAVFKNIPE